MKTVSAAFLLIVFTLLGCDKERIFDDYHTIDKEWHKDSIVDFDLPEVDLNKKYNLFINLRANSDYPFNNIFLIVLMEHPGKTTTVDTLEYQMADESGKMLGNGFSDIKESKLFYKENVRFKKGLYRVKIRHAVRETGKVNGPASLKGISEVGFRIESTE
jgi:gliding motility-associated lipoprotein GldH